MVRLALFVAAGLAGPTALLAQLQQAQIEQSRQFSSPRGLGIQPQTGLTDISSFGSTAAPDDAFGAQLILKEQPRVRPFSAFAEVAAFFTNNVALVSRVVEEDNFLVVSAGAAFSHRLAYDLRFDAAVRGSIYRYGEFRELDFQSVDLSTGVAWAPPEFKGVEVFFRYAFTDLTTADGGDEFYKNHAILLGAHKVFPLSRAQALYTGVTALWSFADPKETGRDEYAFFAGYRVQATRQIEADLFYRFGHYDYRESDGRRDNNHTLALTLRYAPVEWMALSATTFLGFNRSNEEAFDYDVLNAGVSIQVSGRF